MTHQAISIAAGIISFGAYFLYLYGMWRGHTRPSRSSWWLLTIVWGVLFLSSLSLDHDLESRSAYIDRILQISYIIGSLAIAISTIWRGKNEKWQLFDYFCAVSVGVALMFYFMMSAPLWSLIMAILADFFALVPTIKNAKDNPENEHKLAWTIELFASIIALFGIPVWGFGLESLSLWLPILYLIFANLIITLLIYFKRKK